MGTAGMYVLTYLYILKCSIAHQTVNYIKKIKIIISLYSGVRLILSSNQ